MSTLKSLVFWGGLLVALIFGAVLIRLAWNDHLGAEVVLPLLAIGGIVCLLMALPLVAILFAKRTMLKSWQRAVLPLLFLAFAGCQTFSGQPRQPYEDQRVPKFVSFLSQNVVNGKETCTDVECRNQIISGWLEAADYYYHELERRIGAVSQGINVTGDVGAAAASAAGTVVAGTHGKTVLAAISTFFGGTKSALDKNLFGEQSSQVLAARMRSLRQAALVRITKGLHEPLDAYSLMDAKIDLNLYFEAGSIDAAVSNIQGDSSTQAKKAGEDIESVRNLDFGFDANSSVILNFWRPGRTENKEHAQALHDWLDINDSNIDLASVVNSKQYADDRGKIVDKFINVYGPDDASTTLRALWKPNGKEDKAKKDTIGAYIKANVVSNPDMATFIYSREYAGARADAVSKLKDAT